MKYLIASITPSEVARAAALGVHGIITNPSVIRETPSPWQDHLRQALTLQGGPVHLQATESGREAIVRQMEGFRELVGTRLVAKLCLGVQELAAMRDLHALGVLVNITGLSTPLQASVAAQAGADYVSLYVGRAEKFGDDGIRALADVRHFLDLHGYPAQIIAASLQHKHHLWAAAQAGAHQAAVPLNLMETALEHPVLSASVAGFKADWAAVLDSAVVSGSARSPSAD